MKRSDFKIRVITRNAGLKVQAALMEYVNLAASERALLVDFPVIGLHVAISARLWSRLSPTARRMLYIFGLGASVGLGFPMWQQRWMVK